MLTFASSTEAFESLLGALRREGTPSSPRGKETVEMLAVSFRLENIRARVITSKERRWSLPFALGEFCWQCRGSDDLNALTYYSKQWSAFSEDGRTITGSCYGRRLFMPCGTHQSQWDQVRTELQKDPYSRRAAVIIGGPLSFWGEDPLDVPCIVSAQFLLRNNKLNMIVSMRSNDIIWGLGYDVFLFTMLQERMALELQVEPGWYAHHAGSLHLYKRHFKLAQRVLDAISGPEPAAGEMQPMASVEDIASFSRCEELLRQGFPLESHLEMLPASVYWRKLAFVLAEFAETKRLAATP